MEKNEEINKNIIEENKIINNKYECENEINQKLINDFNGGIKEVDIYNNKAQNININNKDNNLDDKEKKEILDYFPKNNNIVSNNFIGMNNNIISNSELNNNQYQNEDKIINNINQFSYNNVNTKNNFASNSSKNMRHRNLINKKINNNVSNDNFYNSNMTNNNILLNNTSNTFLNLTQTSGYNMQYSQILNSYNDKKILENCANLCKDQLKCRILQKKLDENPSLASSLIYIKIKDKFYEISMDQFGNYFMQKVIGYLNMEHIKELLYKKLPSHFRCLCFNQYGTRVIQKLFEKIVNVEEYLDFYSDLLSSNLNDFIKDQNANHIVIKYINTAPSNKINFINEFIISNISDLSTKKHSCCVIQKCIEYSESTQKKEILKAIAEKSYKLINDQYGNYVIQYCINVCDYEINQLIAENFLKNIEYFSMQKYSSNVIEKCLDCSNEETKEMIVTKYCDSNLIKQLLFNVYGNYIIQKVVILAKEPLRSQYIQIIGPLMSYLLFYPHGQKLYNKLLSSFRELYRYINGGSGSGNNFKKKKNEEDKLYITATKNLYNSNKKKKKKNYIEFDEVEYLNSKLELEEIQLTNYIQHEKYKNIKLSEIYNILFLKTTNPYFINLKELIEEHKTINVSKSIEKNNMGKSNSINNRSILHSIYNSTMAKSRKKKFLYSSKSWTWLCN